MIRADRLGRISAIFVKFGVNGRRVDRSLLIGVSAFILTTAGILADAFTQGAAPFA